MESHFWTRCFICVAMVFALSSTSALAQEEAPQEKLYNFDDMLIDGAFRDPQGMSRKTKKPRKNRRCVRELPSERAVQFETWR